MKGGQNMKKVLIFTASIGGGHNEAASCLEKQFRKHGFIVKKLDALLVVVFGGVNVGGDGVGCECWVFKLF